jgi:transcriptional regulator with GAF, ATPase, and Fis domain
MTPEALDVLEQYGWLGNAREPRKAIERAIRGVATIEP